MGINAGKITQDNPVALAIYEYTNVPAISQTNVLFARFRPGYAGEVVGVRANARTVNGWTVTEVRVVAAGADTGQNVLTATLTPVAVATNSPANGSLQANRTLRRFTATQELVLVMTTGGTAPVDPRVEITVRPYPLNGEA